MSVLAPPILRDLPISFSSADQSAGNDQNQQRVTINRPASSGVIRPAPYFVAAAADGVKKVLSANPHRVAVCIRALTPGVTIYIGGGGANAPTTDNWPAPLASGIPLNGGEMLTIESTDEINARVVSGTQSLHVVEFLANYAQP